VHKVQKDKIRIKDIAILAKVSVGTVDRVLHNRGEVSVETRQQILTIVDELGYTPNLIAKSLALKKTHELAVLIPSSTNDNPYWDIPLSGIKQASQEIRDFNSQVKMYYFDLNNEQSFIESLELLLKSNPDGIIFTPIFPAPSIHLIKICEEKFLPYIFIDVNIDGQNNLAFFGQNAYQSGFLAARLMDYGIPAMSNILVLKLAHALGIKNHLVNREIGFNSFYSNHNSKKDTKITSYDIDISNESNIDTSIDSVINQTKNLRGIFVTNSRVHIIANYLEKRDINDVILIGYDLTERNQYFLEKGTIDFLIGQKTEDQSYKSVLALFNHLVFNREIKKINYSPIDIIMKENIDFYKNYKF
jgi:LacI family transcriptional regulator